MAVDISCTNQTLTLQLLVTKSYLHISHLIPSDLGILFNLTRGVQPMTSKIFGVIFWRWALELEKTIEISINALEIVLIIFVYPFYIHSSLSVWCFILDAQFPETFWWCTRIDEILWSFVRFGGWHFSFGCKIKGPICISIQEKEIDESFNYTWWQQENTSVFVSDGQ